MGAIVVALEVKDGRCVGDGARRGRDSDEAWQGHSGIDDVDGAEHIAKRKSACSTKGTIVISIKED